MSLDPLHFPAQIFFRLGGDTSPPPPGAGLVDPGWTLETEFLDFPEIRPPSKRGRSGELPGRNVEIPAPIGADWNSGAIGAEISRF